MHWAQHRREVESVSIDLEKVHDIIAPTCINGKLTNLAPGMSFWHDGTPLEGGTAVTAATVTVAAGTGDITLKVNGAVDSRIGSSGVIDSNGTAYDTCVEIYNHVNAVTGWHCRIEGVLPSTSSDHLLYTLAETNCFQTIATATIDTVACDIHGLVISNRRLCTTGWGMGKKHAAIEDEHGAINKLGRFWMALDASASGGDIKVYSVGKADPNNQSDTFTETLLFQRAHAAGAAQSDLDFASHPITAKPNEHLVIIYADGGDITTVDECFCNGKSVLVR